MVGNELGLDKVAVKIILVPSVTVCPVIITVGSRSSLVIVPIAEISEPGILILEEVIIALNKNVSSGSF